MAENIKYTFTEVCFAGDSPRYPYLSNIPGIRENSVVIVPTEEGDKYATVTRVIECTADTAPCPPDTAKAIRCIIGRKTRINTENIETRTPRDISLTVERTPSGYSVTVTGKKERRAAEKKYKFEALRETFPVSMAGTVVEKDGQTLVYPPDMPSYWMIHEHRLGDEFECANCHTCYDKNFTICPNCRKRMTYVEKAKKKKIFKATLFIEKHTSGANVYRCSRCNTVSNTTFAVCPYCAAKMTNAKSDRLWVDDAVRG